MSGRCAVLRNKKEREKEERLAEKESMEQIGEKRGETIRGRKSKPLSFSIFKERGRLFFRFFGKGHKAQKEPECLYFVNGRKTGVSVLEKAV